MQIVLYPDPVLLKKAAPIEFGEGADAGDSRPDGDQDWSAIGREMLDLMYQTGGVGLAAPQVGLGKRILVLNPSGDPEKPEEEMILLNPEIIRKKGKEWGLEGCLSFPGVSGEVQRAIDIRVKAQTPTGEEIEFGASEFLARVIQHEMDHLQGIVFIDRFSPADRIKMKLPIEELIVRYEKRKREAQEAHEGVES
jgi:peptide deformylase